MSDALSLSDTERVRFAAFLRQEAHTSNGMIEQAAKLGMGEAMTNAMTKRFRVEAAAFAFVAEHLTRGETMTVSASEVSAPPGAKSV